jgi:hypothetical protein
VAPSIFKFVCFGDLFGHLFLNSFPSDSTLAHVGPCCPQRFHRLPLRKADNTIRRQAADLARFVEFLNQVGEQAGLELGAALSQFAQAVATFPDGPHYRL